MKRSNRDERPDTCRRAADCEIASTSEAVFQIGDTAQRGEARRSRNQNGARPSSPQRFQTAGAHKVISAAASICTRCGLEGRAPEKSSQPATISTDTDRVQHRFARARASAELWARQQKSARWRSGRSRSKMQGLTVRLPEGGKRCRLAPLLCPWPFVRPKLRALSLGACDIPPSDLQSARS